MKQIVPSATLKFGREVREHVRLGKEIISLGLGEAEVGTPQHIVEAGIRALRDGITRYSSPQGLLPLRERIAHYLISAHDIGAKPEQIIVTPGAKNALFLACAALLNPGDEVVLLRPCYVSNAPIIRIASSDIVVREIGLTSRTFDLDWAPIKTTISERSRLLFINTPHNPTGRMLTPDDISFIVDIMLKYPRLYLLSDEVYEAMVVGDKKHLSPASISDIAQRVITVGGFSKSYFMTGWRIGYAHTCGEATRAMLAINEHINTNTAAFIQHAAIAALDGSQECVINYVKKLKKRKVIYDSLMEASANLSGSTYEGGYFTFINCSASGMDCDTFAVELLKHANVAIMPGIAFGQEYSKYCRLSFVNTTELFKEGLKRLDRFMESIVNEKPKD